MFGTTLEFAWIHKILIFHQSLCSHNLYLLFLNYCPICRVVLCILWFHLMFFYTSRNNNRFSESRFFKRNFWFFYILQVSNLSLGDDLRYLSLYTLSRFCLVCRDWDHLCVTCSWSRFSPLPISSADGGRYSLWDFWPYMMDSVQYVGHNYNIPSAESFDIETYFWQFSLHMLPAS
jgi:hypothetical protein